MLREQMTKTPYFWTTFLVAAVCCFAQSERGNITGVLTDPANAAIPGASVRVINMGTNAVTRVITSSLGEYSAANLGPGTYRVEASAGGFQSAIVQSVVL